VLDSQDLGEQHPASDHAAAGGTGAGAAEDPAPTSGLPLEPPTEAIRRLEEESADLRDRHLRLVAEFDNFRKRVNRERTETWDRAQAALAVKLLEVLDDLDRVVAGGQPDSGDVVQQALILIDRKLRKELDAAGLERIDPAGQPFDPAFHEAVSVVPLPPGAADHTVSATLQAGYRFKGALIRPARVQVFSGEGHA
jgi:molecular chaperone GrpE